ncbi:MAG: cell division protein FtsZ, partial [Aeromicrobium sp.]
ANIIFGAVIDDALGDEVRVTVIAAGFDGGEPKVRDASQPALLKETPADPPTAESFLAHDPVLDGQQSVTVPADPPPTEYGDDLDIPDFLR